MKAFVLLLAVTMPQSNSYSRRWIITPEGIVFPVWAPANATHLKRSGATFILFDDFGNPLQLAGGVWPMPQVAFEDPKEKSQ